MGFDSIVHGPYPIPIREALVYRSDFERVLMRLDILEHQVKILESFVRDLAQKRGKVPTHHKDV